jgi:hypothetical protein
MPRPGPCSRGRASPAYSVGRWNSLTRLSARLTGLPRLAPFCFEAGDQIRESKAAPQPVRLSDEAHRPARCTGARRPPAFDRRGNPHPRAIAPISGFGVAKREMACHHGAARLRAQRHCRRCYPRFASEPRRGYFFSLSQGIRLRSAVARSPSRRRSSEALRDIRAQEKSPFLRASKNPRCIRILTK